MDRPQDQTRGAVVKGVLPTSVAPTWAGGRDLEAVA